MHFSVLAASAETISFIDIGMATEFTEGNEGTTPVGTFYLDSNNQQMEISLNTYCNKWDYEIRIYVNDELVKYVTLGRESNLLVTVSSEFLKEGQNTIYVKASNVNFEDRPLIIYGTSTITLSEDITPLPDNTITFTNVGIATDFTEGIEGTTPVGTFNVDSNNQQVEILLHTYCNRAYLKTSLDFFSSTR